MKFEKFEKIDVNIQCVDDFTRKCHSIIKEIIMNYAK